MQDSCDSLPGTTLRRLVLGTALAAGLAAGLVPGTASVGAADFPHAGIVAQAPSSADETPPADKATAPRTPSAAAAPKGDADTDTDSSGGAGDARPSAKGGSSGATGIIIEKGDKRVRIQGFGRDREYDSFEQFLQQAPWLAGLIFLTVMFVFLVPLLIIVLLIWYKMRKNRLANETMLKLAERGVVPPAVAMDAVASGTAASLAAETATPATGGATTPAYEHARLVHRRVVWSDLRKGVILTGIGLGLSLYSMFDDGTPNGLGLVFLFVGLGYCLLWFFEDRTRPGPRDSSGTPPAGGGT